MFNFDNVTKENIKEHEPNQPKIPDHAQRVIIIGSFGSKNNEQIHYSI